MTVTIGIGTGASKATIEIYRALHTHYAMVIWQLSNKRLVAGLILLFRFAPLALALWM
jgi:hypothetical protein